jgi:hypothetical protein
MGIDIDRKGGWEGKDPTAQQQAGVGEVAHGVRVGGSGVG